VALLQLIGPLRKIEVDQRLEARLDVDPDSALFGRSEQDADATCAHRLLKAEEFLALLVVVNDGDLSSGNASRNEFCLDVFEEVEVAALMFPIFVTIARALYAWASSTKRRSIPKSSK
jgi:hypothetical protein